MRKGLTVLNLVFHLPPSIRPAACGESMPPAPRKIVFYSSIFFKTSCNRPGSRGVQLAKVWLQASPWWTNLIPGWPSVLCLCLEEVFNRGLNICSKCLNSTASTKINPMLRQCLLYFTVRLTDTPHWQRKLCNWATALSAPIPVPGSAWGMAWPLSQGTGKTGTGFCSGFFPRRFTSANSVSRTTLTFGKVQQSSDP